jgi:thioredoxin reductase
MDLYDVIIIGGGPAGLNAAVVLGRCRRKVLLFDSGNQRNRRSQGIHNYLTQDHIAPADFLKLAHREIRKYGVHLKHAEVSSAQKQQKNLFLVIDKKGNKYQGKKLLVATGLTDRLPTVEGFQEFFGSSIFHCPYCDGWEVRDKKIGLYARNKNGFELALALITWSNSVTYFTDGKRIMDPGQARVLESYRIPVVTGKIEKLEGSAGKLKSVLMKDGDQHPCDAMFFVNGYSVQSHIVESLGCILTKKKAVITNRLQQTNIPGVYVAGDASKDMHFVVVAAAEGAKAGVTINKELQKEERTVIIERNSKPSAGRKEKRNRLVVT